MKQKIFLAVLAVATLWRFAEESLVLLSLSLNRGQWIGFLSAIGILFAMYVFPIATFLIWWSRRNKIPSYWLLVALVAGGVLIGNLSGLLNYHIAGFLESQFSQVTMLKEWLPAIVPPLIEEMLKVLVAFGLVWLFGISSAKQSFLIGAATGLGFQFSEDYTYLVAALVDGKSPIYDAVSRLETAYASHWLLTGIFTVGIYCLCRKTPKFSVHVRLLCLLAPLFLHITWNSPFIDNNMLLKIIVTVISWAIFIFVWNSFSSDSYHEL